MDQFLGSISNPKPRQRYTAEFKAQAAELISTGKPVSQIAEELCIGSNLLYKWKQDSQGAQAGDDLKQALGTRDTVPDLIFHSDRGSQYGSGAYRQILSPAGMRQSMSARANPYHNAWTEIFDYIDANYNNHRKHSALNYRTPAQFEAKIHSLN